MQCDAVSLKRNLSLALPLSLSGRGLFGRLRSDGGGEEEDGREEEDEEEETELVVSPFSLLSITAQ